MNPYYPGMGGPPPPAPPQGMDELRRALRDADAGIAEARAALDNHARSRRYKELALAAKRLATDGEAAQKAMETLDRLMDEDNKRRKGQQ